MKSRPPQSQDIHDKIIKNLACHLMRKNFHDIRADHPDFNEKPSPITNRESNISQIPDVTAIGIQMVLFEVETDDSLNDPHTQVQWKMFSSYADQNMAEFWIVVPKGKKVEAWERVSRLEVNAKVMEI